MFRQDLRLMDNSVWETFINECNEGVCFWFMSPSCQRSDSRRISLILEGLEDLSERLEKKGLKLIIFDYSIQSFWQQIRTALSSSAYHDIVWYFSREFTFEEQSEEALIEQSFSVRADWQSSLIHPMDLPFEVEELPEVFTAFRKRVEKTLRIRPLKADDQSKEKQMKPMSLPDDILNLSTDFELLKQQLYDPTSVPISGGESKALLWLADYFADPTLASSYKETRNGLLLWTDSTKFSPYLAQGFLSPRQIYWRLKEFEKEIVANDSTYWIFFELLWRDYFRFLALKWGRQFFTGMSKKWSSSVPVKKQQELFRLWCSAHTGQDFVDAHMLELNETGWMSNRGRQVVASYLSKSLGVQWKWGATYFEEKLIDYDPASNWGNWAYQAGVGQDPRDRVFNPQRQAEMYDPNGAYQQKWLKR